MSDDPVTVCEVCGKPVERVFHPIAVHFKGSGFYTTDYAKKGAATQRRGLEVGVEGLRLGVGRKSDSKSSESASSSGSSRARRAPSSSGLSA